MRDQKLWFRAKKYGWGWYPVSWQGWLVLAIYLAIIIPIFTSIDKYSHSGSDTLINFALPFIGLTSILLSICYVKGEWPRWQWSWYGSTWPESQKILQEIKKAKSILLHCHPSPDPDSVGSALAMKFAIKQLGKKVTVIQGDSEIPQAFMHFPGAGEIVKKNFCEIDTKQFDLFIVLDSSFKGISRVKEIEIPSTMKVVNIDHHRTNPGAGSINIVDPTYPANCLILYKLFKDWGIIMDSNIATNLFIGTYTDTGGFKYEGVNQETFTIVSELSTYIENIPLLISKMENSNTPEFIAFKAAALNSLQIFCNGKLAISTIPNSIIKEKNIPEGEVSPGVISSILRSVPDWGIVAAAAEIQPNNIKLSFRSSDSNKYDVSRIAAALGGGGHKAASGAVLSMSLDEAVKKVVDTAKNTYNI